MPAIPLQRNTPRRACHQGVAGRVETIAGTVGITTRYGVSTFDQAGIESKNAATEPARFRGGVQVKSEECAKVRAGR
ncbi:hypothetical protein JCM10599A_12330 [Paraburkholderia kururiensis]